MPYDTNGNYTLPTIYYAISGTVINPSQHNSPFEDVQAALNRTLLRDGTAAMTENLNAGGNKITNVAQGVSAGDVVTVSQLGGYLSLSAGGDITGGVTISGQPIVVGASSDHSNYIQQITYDTTAQAFGYLDGEGVWRYSQPQGDYATNTQLSEETQRATTIESNLQSEKVAKSGDTMPGGLTITSGAGLVVSADPGGQTNGKPTNYGGITSQAGGRGGSFGFYVQELVGSTFNGVVSLGFSDGTYRYLGMPGKNTRLNDSALGDLAYTSDLSSYVPATTYTADFATSDVRVTNLPYSQRIVSFSVLITTNGQYVPFPEAFADIPTSVVPGDCGNDAGKTDAWPVAAPMQKWTAAGCNIYIGSGAVPRRVSIIAKGSR